MTPSPSPRVALILALAALAACDRPTPLPDMGLSTSAVLFEAPAAAGDPAGQSVFVVNTGEGALAAPKATVAYQDGAAWLTATVVGQGAPYEVQLKASVGSLGPGRYRATVTLTCPGASSSPSQVAATLDVPDPRFALSRAALQFDAPPGGDDPPAQELVVTNGGRGLLPVPQVTVSYVEQAGWLSTVLGGTPAGYTVRASADVTGLAPGTYSATVTFTAAGDAAPPRTLGVTLVVPFSEFMMHAGPIRIVAPADGSDPAPVDLAASSLDGGTLPALSAEVSFQDPAGPRWLTAAVLPPTQESQQLVRLSAFPIHPPRGLQAGSHFATVLVSTPAAISPVPVGVELVIPPPAVALSPASVVLTRYAGCSVPAWTNVGVYAPGPAALPPITATVDAASASWLRAEVSGIGHWATIYLEVTATPPVGAAAVVTLSVPGASPSVLSLPVSVVDLPAPPLSVSLERQLVEYRVQAGAAGRPETWISLYANTCIPTEPRVSIGYPPGTTPWLTVEFPQYAGSGNRSVALRASAAGMAPGETHTATVTFPDLVAAGAVPLTATITASGLTAAGPMTVPRAGHTLTALDAGEALAAGGEESLASAEVFQASTRTWRPTGDLLTGRTDHGAVYLQGGVLVCGGRDAGGAVLRSCEYWFPSQGQWMPSVTLVHARLKPTLVFDSTSRLVFVVDEFSPPEVIDMASWTTAELPSPGGGRGTAIAWAGVLVAGGSSSDLYDTWTARWVPQRSAPLGVHRARPALVAIQEPGVQYGSAVLALGGGPGVRSAEYYNGLRWIRTTPSSSSHDIAGTCSLPYWSGQAVAVAGYAGEESAAVELFDPTTLTWSVPYSFPTPRAGTKVVGLVEGTLLFAGGTVAGSGPTADTFTW